MRIAICDDDSRDRETLCAYLERYREENALNYAIDTFSDGPQLIHAVRNDPEVRIVFLDIYMKPMSGIEVGQTLRGEDGAGPAIVFTTVSTDHYAESYEVRAEHYLLKPLSYDRVCAALRRCEALLAASARYADLMSGRCRTRVLLRDIRYVEVLHNTCIVHAGYDVPVTSTLDALLAHLGDARFARCHRSYAVNMARVARLAASGVLLKDGTALPLGRSYATQFERAYYDFLLTRITPENDD